MPNATLSMLNVIKPFYLNSTFSIWFVNETLWF